MGGAFGLGDGVGWGLDGPDGCGDGGCVVPGFGNGLGCGELGPGLGPGEAVPVGLGVGVVTGSRRSVHYGARRYPCLVP
ncbi:hypothetical protein ACIRTB_30560 [Streptomyces sp. NPDC101158]|uniref:hypothetical protein n=1 Tax=Streptomyces sp. NPDC101158 TaxID=3366117 RepID=UPI00382E24D2